MFDVSTWLAQADSELNQWLGQNPLVLGGIFLALGGVILGFGILGLVRGQARDKFGTQYSGGTALFLSIVRVIGGVFCLGFGAYKMLFG